jgi:hypothetical protein
VQLALNGVVIFFEKHGPQFFAIHQLRSMLNAIAFNLPAAGHCPPQAKNGFPVKRKPFF